MRRPGCLPGAWSSSTLRVVDLHLNLWTFLSDSFTFCFINLVKLLLASSPILQKALFQFSLRKQTSREGT